MQETVADGLQVLPLRIYHKNYASKEIKWSPHQLVRELVSMALEHSDNCGQLLKSYLSTLLRLPTIMDNYATRTQQKMAGTLQELLKEAEDGES